MTKIGEVYLCEICGNKVKVLATGKGTRLLWKTNGVKSIGEGLLVLS